MRAHWPTAHDAKKPHPATVPQPVTSNRFIGIFGTGRQMATRIANEGRKRELIKSDQTGAKHPARRFAPRITKVTGVALLGRSSTARMIFPATTHIRRPAPFLQSGECNQSPHQMSEVSRHGGPYSRAPAQNISDPQSVPGVPGHFL